MLPNLVITTLKYEYEYITPWQCKILSSCVIYGLRKLFSCNICIVRHIIIENIHIQVIDNLHTENKKVDFKG